MMDYPKPDDDDEVQGDDCRVTGPPDIFNAYRDARRNSAVVTSRSSSRPSAA